MFAVKWRDIYIFFILVNIRIGCALHSLNNNVLHKYYFVDEL